jgi:hypothetical protein
MVRLGIAAVLAATALACRAGADGLVYRLPPDAAPDSERLTFTSRYDGPLAGGNGRWTYQGEHRVWLSDRVPFGVAALSFDSTATETSGADRRTTFTTRGTRSLTALAHGTGATSRIDAQR